jgi:small conductance mechanosensitive channel
MLKRILSRTFPVLAVLVAGVAVLAQTGAPSATTVPASQPTQVIIVNNPPATRPGDDVPRNVIDALDETTIGKIIYGKRTLTLDDVKNPIFWFDTAKDLVVTILKFIPRLLGTMVFLFVFWLIYRGIRKMIVGSMKKQEVDSSIRDLLGALIKWAVMGFGVVIACNQLGIPIVAMLTGVSIIGLAVGFAAQETLANFIAGIVIFLDKPFKVGDWIQVGDQQGAVRRITFRSTRFVNLDNDVVVIPNTQILSTQIINKTTNPITRVNVPMGIAYKESIEKARQVLISTTRDDPRIEQKPEPEVIVRNLNASSVDLMLHFWIKEERYEDAMVWEYLEKCKEALDAAGIEIPFPHMQLLVEDTPAIKRLGGVGEGSKNNGN